MLRVYRAGVSVITRLPDTMDHLWSEVMNWACYSVNLIATMANPEIGSLFEVWHGQPTSPQLRPFVLPAP